MGLPGLLADRPTSRREHHPGGNAPWAGRGRSYPTDGKRTGVPSASPVHRTRRDSGSNRLVVTTGVPIVAVAKGRAAEVRVRSKETVKLGGLDVTNRTANSIMVKKTAVGLVVTNCCLQEQGM